MKDTVISKPLVGKDLDRYTELALWCNQNNCIIVENESSYSVKERDRVNNAALKYEIRCRLAELAEDMVQDSAGLVVPDIESKKVEFRRLHAEIRQLEGKEAREEK